MADRTTLADRRRSAFRHWDAIELRKRAQRLELKAITDEGNALLLRAAAVRLRNAAEALDEAG